MRIAAFRIRNFRSIVDTGWVNLASDGITALVGQNEAGKTSVLRAIHAFQNEDITPDDQRSDDSVPEVYLSFELSQHPSSLLKGIELPTSLDKEIRDRGMRVNFLRTWDAELRAQEPILDPDQSFVELFSGPIFDEAGVSSVQNGIPASQFARALLDLTPDFTFFSDEASLLPDRINLGEVQTNYSDTEGFHAVKNFITVADLKVSDLGNPAKQRQEERRLRLASERITKDFQSFWEQTVGKESKVAFECVLKRHDPASGQAGEPYLEFLVNDNKEQLHLKQRSKGLQWFLSFYLQLRAHAMNSDSSHGRTFFLIDEPGGSLHAKAQENVLKVLEDLKKEIQVIYTTHSPFLINVEELGRILVAERSDDEDEGSPTTVKDVHTFSAENEDALFPVYAAIGADLSHQRLVAKTDNVLLEEMSAYHYLRAFCLLARKTPEPHFIPGSGATTTAPMFANLLTGWGLRFIVFVDNDDEGKRILRKIKAHLYQGREDLATNDLVPLPMGNTIEDVFMRDDFRRWVLREPDIAYAETNGEYVKKARKSKGLLAARFYEDVVKGDITVAELSTSTLTNVNAVVALIADRLKNQKGRRD